MRLMLALAISIFICMMFGRGVTQVMGDDIYTLPLKVVGGFWIGWSTMRAIRREA